MDQLEVSFTAVYLRSRHGYVGFVEELPGVNSQGQTIDEARANLRRQAAVIFAEERSLSQEMIGNREVVREQFRVSVPAG